MNLHRWNGEFWYVDDRSALKRTATWVLWLGGWGTFRTWPLRQRLHPQHWTPVSLFGHRFTCFGWGLQWRLRGGYWVMTWGTQGEKLYWSPDGTPDSAAVWAYGTPQEVKHAADEHKRERAARRARVAS